MRVPTRASAQVKLRLRERMRMTTLRCGSRTARRDARGYRRVAFRVDGDGTIHRAAALYAIEPFVSRESRVSPVTRKPYPSSMWVGHGEAGSARLGVREKVVLRTFGLDDDRPSMDTSEKALDHAECNESSGVDSPFRNAVHLTPPVYCNARSEFRVQPRECRPVIDRRVLPSNIGPAFRGHRFISSEAGEGWRRGVHVRVLENINLSVSQALKCGRAHHHDDLIIQQMPQSLSHQSGVCIC